MTVSELYGEEDGTIQATFQVVYMIGWAPHDSQPKPKRRGSGQVRECVHLCESTCAKSTSLGAGGGGVKKGLWRPVLLPLAEYDIFACRLPPWVLSFFFSLG